MNSRQIKMLSATVGASALLTMGAVSVAATTAAQDGDDGGATAGPVTTSEITTGETVTESPGSQDPETTVATPEVTAEPAPEAD